MRKARRGGPTLTLACSGIPRKMRAVLSPSPPSAAQCSVGSTLPSGAAHCAAAKPDPSISIATTSTCPLNAAKSNARSP